MGKIRRTVVQRGPSLLFSFHPPRDGFAKRACSLSATQRQISTGMLVYTTELLGKTMVLCCWQLRSTTGKAGGEGEGSQRVSAGNRTWQTLLPGASQRNSGSLLSAHMQIKNKKLHFLKTSCPLCLAWLPSFLCFVSPLAIINNHTLSLYCTEFNPNDKSTVNYRIWQFKGQHRYLWINVVNNWHCELHNAQIWPF